MAFDSLKDACEKLRIVYRRFFHVGQGGSLPQNVAIQFDLKDHHVHDEHGAFVGLDFPKTLLYLVKYFPKEPVPPVISTYLFSKISFILNSSQSLKVLTIY